MSVNIFQKCVGIFTAITLVASCLFAQLPQAEAAATFNWQSKILDLNGRPITSQLKIIIVLWLTGSPSSSDYNTDKSPNTSSANYIYHCEYTVTPNTFGVINIEVGTVCALPDPLPNADMYLQAGIRAANLGVSSTDWITPPNKSTAVLGAVTSQLQSGLGGVESANLIIYDPTTNTFKAVENNDMSTTSFSLTFGDTLTKKIFVEWDATNQWFKFPNKMNFTGGLYLNGVDITTLIGGSAALAQYVGVTATTSGNVGGYNAANALCAAAHAGSHVCTAEEMSYSNRVNPTGVSGVTAWISEHAPGYTSNSNDCLGYTSNNSSHLGAYYVGDSSGGQYWLTSCSRTDLSIACCK